MRIPDSSDRPPCFRMAAVLLLLLAAVSPARAGGPLQVDVNGQPFRWDMSRPIRYAVDPGPLGPRSHDWAVAAVDQAVQTWVAHEFGHLLGLDHSQLNAEQLYDGDPADDALAPVMSYFRGPHGDGSLQMSSPGGWTIRKSPP